MEYHRFQDELRRLLEEVLRDVRPSGRPRYSLRQLAFRLQLTPSCLSEILSGTRKRTISPRMARRILSNLPTKAEQVREFESRYHQHLCQDQKAAGNSKEMRYTQLGSDETAILTQWPHFAVLALAETRGFQAEPAWIAERLGISKRKATTSLRTLRHLGALVRDRHGRYRACGKAFVTTDGISNEAIRRSHEETLELGLRSLREDPIERRYFAHTTMAANPERVAEAKEMIRRFRDRICRYLEGGGEQTEVIRVALCLIPLTKAGFSNRKKIQNTDDQKMR